MLLPPLTDARRAPRPLIERLRFSIHALRGALSAYDRFDSTTDDYFAGDSAAGSTGGDSIFVSAYPSSFARRCNCFS